jgi:methyltransferase (TIGR00027 family)
VAWSSGPARERATYAVVAKRSRTAQGVLAERSVLTEMGVLSDPLARTMVSPAWAAFAWSVRRWPSAKKPWSVTRAGLAARVLWYDTQVTRAVDDGVEQVAVIGAGYDSRAWRLARDDVRFYELDHQATQRDKMRRAPAGGPTYVECDLWTQNAAQALHHHGLDPTRPALFILEGLTMYLSEDVVRWQLSDLAASSAIGSRIATDFSPPPDAGTPRDRRQMGYQRLARAGSGEDFKLLVTGPHAASLVEASGWQVTELTSMRDAARTLVPPDAGLPVNAINEHKSLVAGQRSER